MSKITYTDKVALNINSDIPDINKCNATDMNEIKEVVNENETKILLAVSSSAPATCETGDMYYNTTNDLIYTATGTNTWGSTGEEPTENTIYIVFDSQSAYAYDGNELISVGGGSGDLIMVDPDTPTASTKLYIEGSDLNYQGLEIANSYNTSNSMAYSCNYLNFSKTDSLNPSTEYGTFSSNALKLLANSDYSVSQLYGAITLTGTKPTAHTTNKITIPTNLRPTNDITLDFAGLRCYEVTLNNSPVMNSVGYFGLTIKTNGDLEITMPLYADTNNIRIILIPCTIYIN